MKLRTPDYYEKFRCIDKACEDTCCAGWEVDLDEKAYAYYETVAGPFGDRLRSVLSKEGGLHFVLKPNRDCPFLNRDGLCDLYTQLGEDKLCDTCAMFPRFVEEYGAECEMGLAFSCKTAAELILTYKGKAGFCVTDDKKPLTTYNDIHPELYLGLKASRDTAYALVQNRAYTVLERAALFLDFADALQRCMNSHHYRRIQTVNETYRMAKADIAADAREEKLDALLNTLKRKCIKADAGFERYYNMADIFAVFSQLESVKPEFHQFLTYGRTVYRRDGSHKDARSCAERDWKEFMGEFAPRAYEYEHILVYYIFRYFLKAVYDRDLLGKAKLGIVGLLMVCQMDMAVWKNKGKVPDLKDQIDITHLYSREVEHSDENFAALEQLYHTNEMFSKEHLLLQLLQ